MVLIGRDGRRTLTLLRGGDLHYVIEQRAVHLLEPVRDAIRDDNHVALADATALAALDFFPADLIRCGGRRFHGGAASHERRGAIKNVDDVRVASVNLGDAWSL